MRKDPLLGSIFNTAIDGWDSHLDKLRVFWSSVKLTTGRYKVTPKRVHAELSDVAGHHFDVVSVFLLPSSERQTLRFVPVARLRA